MSRGCSDPGDGILAGTRIATDRGWQPVEAVTVGDMVFTFDHGLQPVQAITREIVPAAHLGRLIAFAPGVIGNVHDVLMPPRQPVMVESDTAEILLGDPFVLMPAQELRGLEGVRICALSEPTELLTLHCNGDEMIYAAGGALLLASARSAVAAGRDAQIPSGAPRYRVMRSP